MISGDNVLTVELFNYGIAEIKSEIQGLKAQVVALDKNVAVNSAKIEMLQHTFYWGFGIMALVIALIPYFRRERKENQAQELTPEKVQSMIDEAISRRLLTN